MYIGSAVTSPRGTVAVSIFVDGIAQSLCRLGEEDKLFVAGTPGRKYELKVTNLTNSRLELIVTVDGQHVVTGAPGDPYRNHGIFCHVGDSFTVTRANMLHSRGLVFGLPDRCVLPVPGNVGVIGIAAWREKVPYGPDDIRPLDTFERTGAPDIQVIRYDEEWALQARDIKLPFEPDPFPGLLTAETPYLRAV
jgi:hypothetical protein